MKWKILFSLLFCCSVAMLMYYSRMPLIEYNIVITESVQQLDKDGYPTGEGYSKQPVTKTYKDNNAATGAAIGFGLIAAASVVGIALSLRREYKM